jgi:hypothetical protein
VGWSAGGDHHRREHIEIVTVILSIVLVLGLAPAVVRSSSARPRPDATATITSVVDMAAPGVIEAAEAHTPAARSAVRTAVPTTKMPPELVATIRPTVSPVEGCTHTTLGETTVTAAHCRHAGFSVEGDIAWTGPRPEWADPSEIPIGATLYSVGYPEATPGAQDFTLSNLGERTVTVGRQPVRVLMGVGDGVPCSYGSSGMIAWVTIDGAMTPIGPMSVFAVDPAVTGLPRGQYVCGFAIG